MAFVSIITFCISGQQRCGLKEAVLWVAWVTSCLSAGSMTVSEQVLSFFSKEMLYFTISEFIEVSFFNFLYMVFPYRNVHYRRRVHDFAIPHFLVGIVWGFCFSVPFDSSRYCYCVTLLLVFDDLSYICDRQGCRWCLFEGERHWCRIFYNRVIVHEYHATGYYTQIGYCYGLLCLLLILEQLLFCCVI